MALRKIVKKGDSLLSKRSREVTVFDERLSQLIDDMIETMRKAEGVGLAAVQVGVLRRVIVMEYGEKLYAFVNPEIIAEEGAVEGEEACLSVPNQCGYVVRPNKITLRARDRYGRAVITKFEGFTARIACHETDHLDGILFTSKVTRFVEEEK